MTENEANSETSTGFPHTFTTEEQSRGGQTMTERRRLTNAMNATKTGKFAKKLDFKFCNGCSYARDCAFFEAGSACKIERSAIRGLVEMTGDTSGLSLMRELMKGVQEMKVLTGALPVENRLPALNQLLQRMLELAKLRFGEKHYQNDKATGPKIIVVGYGGRHGLGAPVSCKNCNAQGKLTEVVEFLAEESEPMQAQESPNPETIPGQELPVESNSATVLIQVPDETSEVETKKPEQETLSEDEKSFRDFEAWRQKFHNRRSPF